MFLESFLCPTGLRVVLCPGGAETPLAGQTNAIGRRSRTDEPVDPPDGPTEGSSDGSDSPLPLPPASLATFRDG
jgi:hypothetical protein